MIVFLTEEESMKVTLEIFISVSYTHLRAHETLS
jgi:hypothetical protein